MSDRPSSGKIHIDSDWKAEAEAAKEQLAAEEEAQQAYARGPFPDPTMADLINLVAMPAALALGGYGTPDGRTVPPDLSAAKLYIDMLALLEAKTKGSVTQEESRQMSGVLHQLRLQYAAVVKEIGRAAASTAPGPE